jgi:tRNA threonylcarbamoyladenosine biosynthesis protein TsaE
MKIISRSPQETLRLGRAISKQLKKSDILCLFGQLGSGKTVFAKGIALGLGITEKEVISPTFVLIRQYPGRVPLYHFDLYRLKDFRQMLTLGYEEYFYDEGVTVIEWAEKLGCLMPQDCLKIEFTLRKDATRLIEMSACGARHTRLLCGLKEALKK